jgi:UDP-D-galactose:(glucosyl)LPS alpha-1,6-D-galactosyltransferase
METAISTTLRQFELDGDVSRLFLLGGSADMSWTVGLPATVVGSASDAKISRYSQYILKLPWLLRSFAPDVVLCADPRAIFVAFSIIKMLRLRAKIVSWMHFGLDRLSHTQFLRLADAHFAISTGVAKDLHARDLDAIYLVYNPVVPPPGMHPRSEVPTFLHLGRTTFGGQKRTDDFLRGLAGLRKGYRVAVVGAGPDEGRLKDLAQQLGLSDKIDWLGWQARPWDAAPACSVLVMTSEYEGFAMAPVEAISRGLPVISTDCHAGPADVIISSVNGWLVPVGGVAQLTERMQNIIDDPGILPDASSVASTATRFQPPRVTAAMRLAIGLIQSHRA